MSDTPINKVVFGGRTLIDLTSLTITPSALVEGVTAINAKGEFITGTRTSTGTQISTWGDLANGGYVWSDLDGE